MDFLNDYISLDTINKLKENYSKEALFNFICNDKNIIEVIEYFKSININNIEGIMLNNINIFIKNVDDIKKMFGKYKKEELSYFINQDVNNIELIWD